MLPVPTVIVPSKVMFVNVTLPPVPAVELTLPVAATVRLAVDTIVMLPPLVPPLPLVTAPVIERSPPPS